MNEEEYLFPWSAAKVPAWKAIIGELITAGRLMGEGRCTQFHYFNAVTDFRINKIDIFYCVIKNSCFFCTPFNCSEFTFCPPLPTWQQELQRMTSSAATERSPWSRRVAPIKSRQKKSRIANFHFEKLKPIKKLRNHKYLRNEIIIMNWISKNNDNNNNKIFWGECALEEGNLNN